MAIVKIVGVVIEITYWIKKASTESTQLKMKMLFPKTKYSIASKAGIQYRYTNMRLGTRKKTRPHQPILAPGKT